MGVTFDPYQPNYGLGEMAAEEEMARRLVGKTLPSLRTFLAELSIDAAGVVCQRHPGQD
jgi:hypothetical protein